jgi:hypothetical protein
MISYGSIANSFTICVRNHLERGEQALALALQRHAQTFGSSDQQANDQVRVLLHILAVYPNAEAQKVQIAFALHRVPANVGIVTGQQLRVRLQPTAHQVDSNLGYFIINLLIQNRCVSASKIGSKDLPKQPCFFVSAKSI